MLSELSYIPTKSQRKYTYKITIFTVIAVFSADYIQPTDMKVKPNKQDAIRKAIKTFISAYMNLHPGLQFGRSYEMSKYILFGLLLFVPISLVKSSDEELIPSCESLRITSRKEWGATHPDPHLDKIKKRLTPWIMVHHTAGKSCSSAEECKKVIKDLETFEMEQQGTKEILSHFFIGGDGHIYEGRGWYYPDEYIPGYGLLLSISFIGDYRNHSAPKAMMDAFQNFLICYNHKVQPKCVDRIFSVHDDHRCTDCPGKELKKQLKLSEHYDHSKSTRPCERHKLYTEEFMNKYYRDEEFEDMENFKFSKTVKDSFNKDKFLHKEEGAL